MATIAFTQFLPEVLPSVSGCADIVAINAVRNAVIDFCTNSLIWAETQDPTTVSSADMPLDLEAPTGATVAMILSAKVGGRTLAPVTQDYLDANQTDWEAVTGDPQYYYQPNPDQVALFPVPQSACTLRLRVAYAPSRSATGCEKFIYENHLEVIAAGALAKLMMAPGQPWANPDMANVYRQIFANGIIEAQSAAHRNLTRAASRVRINTF